MRAEVVLIQAGSPQRYRFAEGLTPGTLRAGDNELLSVAHSPADPATVVLTGQKPGRCVVTGTARGGAERSVLVVVTRPHLRIAVPLNRGVKLELPGGRWPVELMSARMEGFDLRIQTGNGITLNYKGQEGRIRLAEDNTCDTWMAATAEGRYQFTVTDDRGLEWTVSVVTRGLLDAAGKP